MAVIESRRGNYERAVKLLEESLEILNALGDKNGIARSGFMLSQLLLALGKNDEAGSRLNSSLDAFVDIGDRLGEAHALRLLSTLLFRSGAVARSLAAIGRAAFLARKLRIGEAADFENTRDQACQAALELAGRTEAQAGATRGDAVHAVIIRGMTQLAVQDWDAARVSLQKAADLAGEEDMTDARDFAGGVLRAIESGSDADTKDEDAWNGVSLVCGLTGRPLDREDEQSDEEDGRQITPALLAALIRERSPMVANSPDTPPFELPSDEGFQEFVKHLSGDSQSSPDEMLVLLWMLGAISGHLDEKRGKTALNALLRAGEALMNASLDADRELVLMHAMAGAALANAGRGNSAIMDFLRRHKDILARNRASSAVNAVWPAV